MNGKGIFLRHDGPEYGYLVTVDSNTVFVGTDVRADAIARAIDYFAVDLPATVNSSRRVPAYRSVYAVTAYDMAREMHR